MFFFFRKKMDEGKQQESSSSGDADLARKVAKWRSIIVGDTKSWVLFQNDTIVIFTNPPPKDGDNMSTMAIEVMKEYGPVYAGCSAGDFNIIDFPEEDEVWAVTGHHPDMLTMVEYREMKQGKDAIDYMVGLYGRGKRDLDGRNPVVVHIEDKRSN